MFLQFSLRTTGQNFFFLTIAFMNLTERNGPSNYSVVKLLSSLRRWRIE